MKTSLVRLSSVALLAACALASRAFGQSQQQSVLTPNVRGVIDPETEKKIGVPSGPAPRLKNGKPDMSGVWNQPYVPDMSKSGRGQQGAAELPFTPAGLAKWKAYDASQGDYTGNCLPFGLFRNINSPHPMQIVQNDNYIAFLFEQNTWFHVVPTDSRPLPKDPDPTWDGHSVGHWDGDTLVIEVTDFNDKTWFDRTGNFHSDALHVTERYTPAGPDVLEYDATIEDSKVFTRPWKMSFPLYRRLDRNAQFLEFKCVPFSEELVYGHLRKQTSH